MQMVDAPVTRSIYCEHCKEYVPKSTFYRHRRKYYNFEDGVWIKHRDIHAESHHASVASFKQNRDSNKNDDDFVNDIDECAFFDSQSFIDCNQNEYSDGDTTTSTDTHVEWSDSELEDDDVTANGLPHHSPLIQLFFTFLTQWQFIFNVSNSAINVLVSFLQKFFHVLAEFTGNDNVVGLAHEFPKSNSEILESLDSKSFKSFVICPKCNLVYDYENCFEVKRGNKISKQCKFVLFPNHPHKNQRIPCNEILLREKIYSNGQINLVPFKTYPYYSLYDAIKRLVTRPNFLNKCELWRARSDIIDEGILGDVYEGKLWCDLNIDHYDSFLKYPGNLALSLNCDWFQPFSNTQYSVGALYMVILNLPRAERYKIENIILISIIPGPKEPRLTMNTFLAPLIQELKAAYTGWTFCTGTKTFHICARIVCVTCDIPATRKLCGFLGHVAKRGCSKCLKEFPTEKFGEKPDYSGFDRETWPPRLLEAHRLQCEELCSATTKTALQTLEAHYGIRYSLLLDLPYFDPIRFSVIDPMHNLLLGTAKHMFTLWLQRNILNQKDLELLQARSEKFTFPQDVGRIPLKIGSIFAGFTADQWRTWTTVLSAVVLKGLLPEGDYTCWLLFVNACRLLCNRIISKAQIDTADQYLIQFCKKVELLYGKEACTPNMHLHLHLAECLRDYGPVHGFWCFPFERFNGILGGYHTNNKNIETQIMKKFLVQQQINVMEFPDSHTYKEMHSLLKQSLGGSLSELYNTDVMSLIKLSTIQTFGTVSFKLVASQNIKIVSSTSERVFSSDDADKLKKIYQQLAIS